MRVLAAAVLALAGCIDISALTTPEADAGGAEGLDLAQLGDAAAPVDLSAPDLAAPPDLTPPPDMEPLWIPPDLPPLTCCDDGGCRSIPVGDDACGQCGFICTGTNHCCLTPPWLHWTWGEQGSCLLPGRCH